MREIKFRAWDKYRNEMYWPAMLHRPHTKSSENSNFEISRYTGDNPKDSILMQYTGLKDKNGKEIYEGDIVKQEKWVSVGKYEPCIGVIRYRSAEFTVDCIGDWEGSNADINGNAEVIGNIYENEHLLK